MRAVRVPWVALLTFLACAFAQDGWDFTPLSGATSKADASFLALQASFSNGSDPRVAGWWATFKKNFYKTYVNATAEQKAKNNFLYNLDQIYSTNADISIPYWVTGNFYADYDFPTFRSTFLMTNLTLPDRGRRILETPPAVSERELAARRRLQGTTVDWRAKGKLTPVMDQGGCGSCWAYAATAAVESSYLIGTGTTAAQTKLSLSQQQIIDCSGAGTCGGGGSGGAIDYVFRRFQMQGSLYPNTYKYGKCKATGAAPAGKSVKLSASVQYPPHSEAGLMKAVAISPVVIYFNVIGDFFGYAGGIYVPTSCNNAINHAMVAVGYVYTGNPSSSYWIIRNSWGAGWGVNGYAYIQMTGTSSGPCGMYLYMFQAPTSFSKKLGRTRNM